VQLNFLEFLSAKKEYATVQDTFVHSSPLHFGLSIVGFHGRNEGPSPGRRHAASDPWPRLARPNFLIDDEMCGSLAEFH
jgi:hypothetical protein